MTKLDIAALGEAMREFNQTEANNYLAGFGGDTSNAAIAAARQGMKVGYISKVGADIFGEDLLKLWQGEALDVSGVVVDETAPTGIYFVTHGPSGHVFTYRRVDSAAARMTPSDLPSDLLASLRCLHVSGISQAISPSARETVAAAIAQVRQSGGMVSYDTNLRLKLWPLETARAVIHATVPQVDVLLPSYEEAMQLSGEATPDAIVDFYLGLGTKLVALKLGPDGALVATPNERRLLCGHVVRTMDATGAGDTFDGAFLSELLRGKSPFEAGEYANAAAALSTQGYGAVAPIPYRKDVEAFLEMSA